MQKQFFLFSVLYRNLHFYKNYYTRTTIKNKTTTIAVQFAINYITPKIKRCSNEWLVLMFANDKVDVFNNAYIHIHSYFIASHCLHALYRMLVFWYIYLFRFEYYHCVVDWIVAIWNEWRLIPVFFFHCYNLNRMFSNIQNVNFTITTMSPSSS